MIDRKNMSIICLAKILPSVCGGASLHPWSPVIGLGEMIAVFTLHSVMSVYQILNAKDVQDSWIL